MKTSVECLLCFLQQSLRVTRLSNVSKEEEIAVVKEISAMLPAIDTNRSPPDNVIAIYGKIAEMTGNEDPYSEKKKESNEQALKMLPRLQHELEGAANELELAIRFSIAGNIIDYGAFETFDVAKALDACRKENLVVDDCAKLTTRIDNLVRGEKVLYLADNCGEIVYDTLFLDYIKRKGGEIIIAVKDGPIINDATVEDALFVGLDKYGTVISNGTRCPGTELGICSDRFVDYFHSADLVISKGQGNFETLSEVGREVFFLLTIKCATAARHMEQIAGLQENFLSGSGEMAVFCSTTRPDFSPTECTSDVRHRA